MLVLAPLMFNKLTEYSLSRELRQDAREKDASMASRWLLELTLTHLGIEPCLRGRKQKPLPLDSIISAVENTSYDIFRFTRKRKNKLTKPSCFNYRLLKPREPREPTTQEINQKKHKKKALLNCNY